MDITSYVNSKRDRALLVGNYDSYKSQLSRQLLSTRRKLGRTTPKNAKFTSKAPVTTEDVAKNTDFVHVLLIQAERAWAHAMHIKSTHAEDNASKGISGPTRRRILSKLHKAASYAEHLTKLLSDRGASRASDNDYLEAKAYALSLSGAEEFERQVTKSFEDTQVQKQSWKKCLALFSEAHVIYSALLFSTQREVFREVIGGTVDPSIRYAAYQSKLSRTIAIGAVAKREFPKDQAELISLVQKLNPNALSEEAAQEVTTTKGEETAPIPSTIDWRKRTAPIADAAVGQALAATALAASKLSAFFHASNSKPNKNPKKLAAAYDPILDAAQDAIDAVRRCISDLTREGVAESDSRMQDLRVSDLAVNYGLISWRIGRNRVLMSESGADDGMTFSPETRQHKSRSIKHNGNSTNGDDNDTQMSNAGTSVPSSRGPQTPRTESTPHRLARLTARVVLLDSTLQSIDAISSLPGATRDADFQAQLSSQRVYFQALKCLNIGYSHQALASSFDSSLDPGTTPNTKHGQATDGNVQSRQTRQRSALALFARAASLLDSVSDDARVATPPTSTSGLISTTNDAVSPPTLLIRPAALQGLRAHLATLVMRQRGLCTLLADQEAAMAAASAAGPEEPLIAHLDRFPPGGRVDLRNIVTYPPRLEPVPVKPIFLDLAWNYLRYPGRGGDEDGEDEEGEAKTMAGRAAEKVAEVVAGTTGSGEEEQQQQRKKGWFGFGRS